MAQEYRIDRRVRHKVVLFPRRVKQSVVMVLDVILCLFATWLAFTLRLDSMNVPVGYQWHVYQLSPLIMLPVFVRLGLYRAVFRYTGIVAVVSIANAVAIYGLLLFLFLAWFALPGVPRSVGIIQPLLLWSMISASRGVARWWLRQADVGSRNQAVSKMLIYGAGAAGVQIAEVMKQRRQYVVVGFLDDSRELCGRDINGVRVYPTVGAADIIAKHGVSDVVLAMPSATRARRIEILEQLRGYHVHVTSLPDLADLASGKIKLADIRELDAIDLLGRDPVPPDLALIGRNITRKAVMVTGAGGSIGSELCRQILTAHPACLLLLDHNEYSLYDVHRDLLERIAAAGVSTEIIPLLGSVKDLARMRQICQTWHPKTIYHAAAYKHVPLVEHNPIEGMLNNVFGTYQVAEAALESGVENFVLVSTDKAVRPTNVMGATKRLAEMILQALAARKMHDTYREQTRFSIVRFGNVLDSSGSVVPLFRKQIESGGPITLTDMDVTRYFMTIPEAAQLVIQAGAMAEGGEVFLLDMGDPIKIVDLARRMVELYGLTELDPISGEGDIEIQVTGLRPGEKLHEELLINQAAQPTAHSQIMKANEDFLSWQELSLYLNKLSEAAARNDLSAMRKLLGNLVEGYVPASEIVDWISIARSDQQRANVVNDSDARELLNHSHP